MLQFSTVGVLHLLSSTQELESMVLHQRVRWTPRCDMVQAVSFNVPSMGTQHSTWNRALFSNHSVMAGMVEISLIRRTEDYKELEVTE